MSASFHGLPTRSLSNQHVHLEYLTTAGPRIVHLSLAGTHDNLMVECPDIKIPTALGDFNIFGGHRLWHSPEAMPRSYVPDNDPIEIAEIANGVRLIQQVEAFTGIRKSLEITLATDRPAVTVKHTLENCGAWPVELACWALTQLRQGGLAALPQTAHKLDEPGLLPNRNLVLWPYTRLADPRLSLNDDFVFIAAQPLQPPVKVGYLNRHGWLGYLTGGVFFVKKFDVHEGQPHVDFGCNAESYCNDRFIEVESVGPLVQIEPGQATSHIEEWTLHRAAATPQTPDGVRTLVAALGLPVS